VNIAQLLCETILEDVLDFVWGDDVLVSAEFAHEFEILAFFD
jgi:hypothetical protein